MRIIFLISGILSLGIGVIGVILPILPTTPFLLLTGFLFSKSSDRYRDWFRSTKIYQRHLKDFDETRSMTIRQKRVLMIVSDTMILLSFFLTDITVIKVLLLTLLLLKHWYFKKHIKLV